MPENAPEKQVKCKHCDKEFKKSRPKAIFCSTKCRMLWHTARHLTGLKLLEEKEAKEAKNEK